MGYRMDTAAVEDEAVAWLLPQMPGARDLRHVPGAVADLEWDGRLIDLQAYGGLTPRGARVRLDPRRHAAAVSNPRYEVWLVENFLAGPEAIRVTVIRGAQLARLAAQARARQYMEMAVPVPEFTAARASTEDAVSVGLVPGSTINRRRATSAPPVHAGRVMVASGYERADRRDHEDARRELAGLAALHPVP